MYPYDIIFGVGLYEICIIVGLILAMIVFRICADRAKLSAKMQNMVLFAIPVALFVGYPSAVAVQWVYNGIKDGTFSESVFGASTGSTFYGGLIGGTAAFLIFYFAYGHFRLPNKEHVTRFPAIFDMAPCCITIAHAVGRVGCFFAGCCHGIPTDSALGVYFKNIPYKVLPTQLFEVGFLIILFAFLMLRYYDGKKFNMSLYLIGYGIWRFVLEFLRGDDRGETFVDFLTPSQLTAIVLILVGIALFFFKDLIYGRSVPAPAEGGETTPDQEMKSEESPENTDGDKQ